MVRSFTQAVTMTALSFAATGTAIGQAFDLVLSDDSIPETAPLDIALADITGDGLDDAVLLYPNPDSPQDAPGIVVVMVNTGEAASGERVFELRDMGIIELRDIGPMPNRVDIGDLNNDGILDIVVTSPGDQEEQPGLVTWLIAEKTSDSGFILGQSFAIPVQGIVIDVAIAELTGDEFADVVVTVAPKGQLVVIRNNGLAGKRNGRSDELLPPEQEEPEELPELTEPTSIEPGDLDSDSATNSEVVVADKRGGVSIVSRDSENTFRLEGKVPSPEGETQVFLGSIDEDSDDKSRGAAPAPPDIIAVNLDRSEFVVALNTSSPGEFSFTEPVQFSIGGSGRRTLDAALSDVDGDGRPDLVALLEPIEPGGPTQFGILLNQSKPGTVQFEPSEAFNAGPSPRAIASSDLAFGQCDEVVVANGPKDSSLRSTVRTFANTTCGETTVPCPADINGSGEIDISDLLQLLSAFESSDDASDINGDRFVDISDLLILLARFDTSCE